MKSLIGDSPPHPRSGEGGAVEIGEDGPSQMGLEDLAMMRAMPGSTVVYPADANAAAALVAERLNAVLAPIRRLLALAAALGQWRLRRRVTRGGGACAAIPSRLGAGGGPGTTGDRSSRCAMNLLDALPNGGPPDVTPDACAPLPPTITADLSLNVDGAPPARLDRWREVEVAHRRLLEARGLLSAYARAAAELLMMEASPSHRLAPLALICHVC